jgi:peptide/nickel transport system ATP-binding protein
VSLEIEAGSSRALVGESGGGKTLLARAVMRLLPPGASVVSGEIHVGGVDLLELPEREMESRRGGAVGLVFQEPLAAFDPVRPVGAQVAEAVRRHGGAGGRAARDRAVALLEEAGLPRAERLFDAPPHALSGGMRQRAMVAAALAGDPAILIADEPTAALDPPLAAQVLDLFDRLRRERGLAVLHVTHDLAQAARCDRVSVMYAGRIVEEASGAEFARAPRHPYTAALAAATTGNRGRRLPVIPGEPPALAERAAPRCAFAPRCPRVLPRCGSEKPGSYSAGGSRVLCFLYAPEAA